MQEPMIKGKANISITKGTIDCDFVLTGYPEIKDYSILLNSGFKVRYFRSIETDLSYNYERSFDGEVSGESFAYYFPESTGKTKFLPKAFRIIYDGAFPVVFDTSTASADDWKGNIAFNGKTIRASEQSEWYPVLYDITKDNKYQNVKYDIDVTCADCETIYLNGHSPITGRFANFKSDKAVGLLIFAGNYKIVNVNETYFLNPDITAAQLEEFGKMTNMFKNYYQNILSIPYGSKITFIQTTPVCKYKRDWLFVTYPSIVHVGYSGLKIFANGNPNFHTFIAHEIAHYYFGTLAVFNSELGDMILESFPEYLSMKASKKILGNSVYEDMLDKKIKRLKDFTIVPFAKIKSSKDYGDRNDYVYIYAPLIYIAMEKEIGEEKMIKWMRTILNSKAELTNYKFLTQTLGTILNDNIKSNTIIEKYFTSDSSIQNLIQTLKK